MNKPYLFDKKLQGGVKWKKMLTWLAVFMISLFLSSRAVAQDPKVAYAIGSADGKTLTFRYDNNYRQIVKDLYEEGGHKIYEYPQYIEGKNSVKPSTGFTYLEWDYVKKYPAYALDHAGRKSLTTIVFDASFADFEPTNFDKWFSAIGSNLTTITGFVTNVNKTYVTTIDGMFNDGCSIPETLIYEILSQIPMSQIESMKRLFERSNITSFDISKIPNFQTSFNTSNNKDMSRMFEDCQHLETVNMAHMKTNSVTDMSYMFYNCFRLQSVDLSGINTSNLENMFGMFALCSELTIITGFEDEGFNTSKVTDMGWLFYGCEKLVLPESATKSLEVGNVTLMLNMFRDCKSIRKIDLSNTDEDGTNPTKIGSIFEGCISLESVNLKGIYFSNIDIQYSGSEFSGCSTLKEIDLSRISALSGYELFKGCSSLTKIIFPEGGLRIGNNLWSMFEGCESLEYVDFSNFICDNDIVGLNYAFANCTNLINVDLSSLQATIFYLQNSFDGCSKLASVLVSDNFSLDDAYDDDTYFDGCVEIIGGKGTRFNPAAIKKDMAVIDGGESSPGYLTTGEYKVFYVMNDGTNSPDNPSSFAKNITSDIVLKEPTRKGYTFLGWTGTSASGISSTEPTKNVKISPDKPGNREYTAHWLININAEATSAFTYPSDATKYCDGTEKTVTLSYKITSGVATGYIISFENDAIPVVKGAVDDSGEGTIEIPIPESLQSGVCIGKIVFVDETGLYGSSEDNTITITANIPPKAAVQLYTDMLIADNHDGRFTAYQWYKDGSPIADATQGYYYDEKLGGKYTVELTTTDGGKFMSCPVKLVSTKALAQSVKAYPNPARRGETFAVEITDYDPAQEYSIMIFSANGLLVKKLTNVEQTTEMSLPTGVYSGSLISGGSKYGFKLIVE